MPHTCSSSVPLSPAAASQACACACAPRPSPARRAGRAAAEPGARGQGSAGGQAARGGAPPAEQRAGGGHHADRARAADARRVRARAARRARRAALQAPRLLPVSQRAARARAVREPCPSTCAPLTAYSICSSLVSKVLHPRVHVPRCTCAREPDREGPACDAEHVGDAPQALRPGERPDSDAEHMHDTPAGTTSWRRTCTPSCGPSRRARRSASWTATTAAA